MFKKILIGLLLTSSLSYGFFFEITNTDNIKYLLNVGENTSIFISKRGAKDVTYILYEDNSQYIDTYESYESLKNRLIQKQTYLKKKQ